jgi:hypothetical protein
VGSRYAARHVDQHVPERGHERGSTTGEERSRQLVDIPKYRGQCLPLHGLEGARKHFVQEGLRGILERGDQTGGG